MLSSPEALQALVRLWAKQFSVQVHALVIRPRQTFESWSSPLFFFYEILSLPWSVGFYSVESNGEGQRSKPEEIFKQINKGFAGRREVGKHVWSFLYKQCTSSLPLFQRNTNKQTIVCWNSLTEEGHCCSKLFQHTIVCLLVLRWKRGRELVHCLYKKLQTDQQRLKKFPAVTVSTWHRWWWASRYCAYDHEVWRWSAGAHEPDH